MSTFTCTLAHATMPLSLIVTQEKPISGRAGWLTLSMRRSHRFAANQKSQHFTLGAEGSGIVAAVGSGVDNLKVTSVLWQWPDTVFGQAAGLRVFPISG